MIDNLLHLILYIIVIGAIFGLLWWLNDYAVPEPFHRVVRIVIAVVAVVCLIYILLGLVGGGSPSLRLR